MSTGACKSIITISIETHNNNNNSGIIKFWITTKVENVNSVTQLWIMLCS